MRCAAQEPRNPASTMKLLTTLVALDVRSVPRIDGRRTSTRFGQVEQWHFSMANLLLRGYRRPVSSH